MCFIHKTKGKGSFLEHKLTEQDSPGIIVGYNTSKESLLIYLN